MKICEILDKASVIPVLEVTELAHAAPLAQALSKGGLKVIELTMRTPVALDALHQMKKAEPGLIIGMGTVLDVGDMARSVAAGADFLVTPGTDPGLLASLIEADIPALPGVATAGEAMTAAAAGFSALKFFPAEPAGGVAYLKALYGPLPHITFCPTGGISAEKVPEYLALLNVACAGGTWVASKDMIQQEDWQQITKNAQTCSDTQSTRTESSCH